MIFNWNKKENNAKKIPEMRYVEPDKSNTIEKDSVVKKGTLSASHKWARQSQSIARTIPKSEMSGWFSKNIVVSPNEIAVIVQDGKVLIIRESDKYKTGTNAQSMNEQAIIDNIIAELDKKREIAINKKQKAILKDEVLEYGEEEDTIDYVLFRIRELTGNKLY